MSKRKSRKTGLIGVRKDPDFKKKRNVEEKRAKKSIGKPAGSRHNPVADETRNNPQNQQKDKRIGSKKPVALIKQEQPKTATAQKKYFSPAQELETIENDVLMNELLDKVDAGKKLSAEHKQYLEQKLARHKALCELLGIENEEEHEVKPESEQDIYQQFESSNLDEYK